MEFIKSLGKNNNIDWSAKNEIHSISLYEALNAEKNGIIEIIKISLVNADKRKKEYKEILNYNGIMVYNEYKYNKNNDNIHEIDFIIPYYQLIQSIVDNINVLEDAADANIFEYIPSFILAAADDTFINELYNYIADMLGYFTEYAPTFGPGAAAQDVEDLEDVEILTNNEIIDILDAAAEDKKEIYKGYIYNIDKKIIILERHEIKNGDIQLTIKLYSNNSNYYNRIHGNKNISMFLYKCNFIKRISGAEIQEGAILQSVYNTWGRVVEITENPSGGHNYKIRDAAGRVDFKYINQYTKIIQLLKYAGPSGAAENVDQENKVYYINTIISILNNISNKNYNMDDGGGGRMYVLNNDIKIILTAYDQEGEILELKDAGAAAAVNGISLDYYFKDNIKKSIDGAADILDFIQCHILTLIEGPAAEDLEALRWEYDNNIKYMINSINGRICCADGKKIILTLNKEDEILYINKDADAVDLVKGYKNILHYINILTANNFTVCHVCGGTGERSDQEGGAVNCSSCAGTGLYLINNN